MSAPVIVLTSSSELQARIKVFDLGAVDYMPKPFWIEELVARIRARLQLREQSPRRVLRFHGVALDLDARSLTVDGEAVELTATQLNILSYLAERPGRAVTRRQLAESALPALGERFDRTVDGHVSRIRRKLGPHGQAISTVWGIGYRLDAKVEST